MILPRRSCVLLTAGFLFAPLLSAQNHPPAAPVLLEPAAFAVVNPYDVHMEAAPFVDQDPGDQHAATDWEIWTVSPQQLAWRAAGMTGNQRTSAQLGDGVFMNAHAGMIRLFEATSYLVRVRFKDSSGVGSSEWSAWTTQWIVTGAANQIFPLELAGVAATPPPWWTDPAGQPVDLPTGTVLPSLRVESGTAQLLLAIDASAQPGNTLLLSPPLSTRQAIRVVISAGLTGGNLILPETNLTVIAQGGCRASTMRLPAINLAPAQQLVLWVAAAGGTYLGSLQQTAPTFALPARNLLPPYIVREAGYSIDLVASGLQLPVNLAFVPGAGTAPTAPKFYVTELYGAVKTVTNDGTVLTFAGNLLNYTPSGAFPGDGEQGVTGIAVDPVTHDVFVAMLHRNGTQNFPRIVRMTSSDGGRTASSQQVILDMQGEPQAQSHIVSRLEIVAGELYCHMGDGFVASMARSLGSYRGKILRLNLDGSPVQGNPYYNGGSRDARDYIFALGVRNPFGGAWRAADNSRYMVENGPTTDRFARLVPGRDYLWDGANPSMTNFALYNWSPSVGPVNLAFVQPATFGGSGFPAGKMDHAFVTESGPTYAEGQQALGKRITEWVLDAAGNLLRGPLPFVDYVGDGHATTVGLAAGPDGLYFTDLYADLGATSPSQAGGRVMRIRYGSTEDCNGNGQSDWCEIATNAASDCNQNQVIDSCDIALGTSTDFDANAVPDECDALSESRDRLSASSGGRVDFTLRSGVANAQRLYALLGSLSGTVPGQQFGAVHLPLNSDFWFGLTISGANSVVLVNTLGLLDGQGNSSAALVVPPVVSTALIGATLHHAYVGYDVAAAQFVLGSNAVPLHIDP